MPGIIITGEIYSEALSRPVEVSALVPNSISSNRFDDDRSYRTVYMLPGAIESSNALYTEMDLSSAFTDAVPADTILIMISPAFSYLVDYKSDYKYGHRYYTFVTDELITITRNMFPLSRRREDTAIYGCSMGGYGAMYCGLNHPEIYGYIGAQSGMLDIEWAVENRPFMRIKFKRQFGDPIQVTGTNYDLFHLVSKLNAGAVEENTCPKIYQSWGEEDYLEEPNVKFHEHMKSLNNLDYISVIVPGPHGWGLHNQGVREFLKWFESGVK